MDHHIPPLNLQRALRRGQPGAGVPSPCVGVCRMSAVTGLCEGCHRTLDEIADWSTLSDEHKRGVWAAIERRQAAP